MRAVWFPPGRALRLLTTLLLRRDVDSLYVSGRRSGRLLQVAAPLLELHGSTYLVAGPGTHWARNARLCGWGELTHRGRRERVGLEELADGEAKSVLCALWQEGSTRREIVDHALRLSRHASRHEFEAVAHRCSVFEIVPRKG